MSTDSLGQVKVADVVGGLTGYDLRAAVRDALGDTDLTDPGDIADWVVGSMPDDAMREALRLTMRDYVRRVMSSERTNLSTTTGQSAHDTQRMPAGRGGDNSAKRRGIREGWRLHLRNRYHVAGEWIQLADMTADNLATAAQQNADIAAATAAIGDRLNDWSILVASHGAASFGELPDDVLAIALGGAA